MEDLDISIIIVNYNTRQLLADCLHSIYAQTKGVEFEVIVSDNGSTDGSLEMLKAEFPHVVLIENNANLGFGKANNVAAKLARGKYLFFLNSDTVLLNNAIKAFFDFSVSYGIPCIVGSWLVDSDLQYIPSFGRFTAFVRMLTMYLCNVYFPVFQSIRKLFNRKSRSSFSVPHKVDFVTGADLFIPSELYKRLGGFDEKFFMYYEDDDLCRRASLEGCDSLLINSPRIVHLEGKSSKGSVQKRIIQEKSFLYYLKKYSSSYRFRFYKGVYVLFALIRFFSPVFSFREKKALWNATVTHLKETD